MTSPAGGVGKQVQDGGEAASQREIRGRESEKAAGDRDEITSLKRGENMLSGGHLLS